MTTKMAGMVILIKETRISLIRLQEEMEEATIVQQRYSNHPVTNQNRHQLFVTNILRVVRNSRHRWLQHLTNPLRAKIAKDCISVAVNPRKNCRLLLSWCVILLLRNQFFVIVVWNFMHPSLKVQNAVYPSRESYMAISTSMDVEKILIKPLSTTVWYCNVVNVE